MAAIDFPASPTDGQVFSATNGVVYKWSAASGVWLAQNPAPPLGGTGDFCGTYTGADFGIVAAGAVLGVPTIISGNSGLWYNSGNSRYTPPAGRYYIWGALTCFCSTTATGFNLTIRKNGVAVQTMTTSAATNTIIEAVVNGTFDANGTDYFELFASGGVNFTGRLATFGAFPLTGMQGPTGGAPSPVVGDFLARHSTTMSLGGAAILPINTVLLGNSGGYYSTSTFRYTPPAGRYRIYCGGTFWSSAAAASSQLQLRKNGSTTPIALTNVVAGSSWEEQAEIDILVDANGSDYFEVWGTSGNAATFSQVTFSSFPTQGMVGPQGPAGVISNGYRLISRVVPTAGQATVDFTNLPSDINDLEVRFDVSPTVTANDFFLWFFDNTGVIDTTTGHYAWSMSFTSHIAANASNVTQYSSGGVSYSAAIILNLSVATARVNASWGIRGNAKLYNIRDSARYKSLDFQTNYMNDGGSAIYSLAGEGTRSVIGAITGLRLGWGATTFAAGGAVSLWGSP